VDVRALDAIDIQENEEVLKGAPGIVLQGSLQPVSAIIAALDAEGVLSPSHKASAEGQTTRP
jgi:hypothetical protein